MTIYCHDCKHSAPDGTRCEHPDVTEDMSHDQRRQRSSEGLCGPDGDLFEAPEAE